LPHLEGLRWTQTIRLPAGKRPPAAATAFRPKVITVIPEGQVGFRNVFGRHASEEELGNIRDLGSRLTPANGQNLGGVDIDAAAVRLSFQNARAQGHETVLLVGHSTGAPGQARILRLPGGSKITVDQLHVMAAEEGVNLRVMTCHGGDFGVDARLSLGNALRLIQVGTQSVELLPDVAGGAKPSGAGAADNVGLAGATLSGWDARVIRTRDRMGLSDVVISGSVLDGRNGLRLWESACRRPFWLGVTAWLLLAGGLVANFLVMRWQRRQEVGRYESLGAMEAGVAEVLRTTNRLRRATRLGVPLTLVLAVLAATLVRQDQWHGEVSGRVSSAWFVNVPATLGVAGMLLAALAARVQTGRSRLGRVVLGLSGAVAGGAYAALVGAALVGGVGLVLLLFVNLLHVIACLFNGFARFRELAGPTVLLWALITAGAAGLALLYGVYQGALAGFHDLPLLLALTKGSRRLVVRDPGALRPTRGHAEAAREAGTGSGPPTRIESGPGGVTDMGAGDPGRVADTAARPSVVGSGGLAAATVAAAGAVRRGLAGGTTRPRRKPNEILGAAVGLTIAAAVAIGLPSGYVYSLIDVTPFPAGARVTLVRDAVDRELRFPDIPGLDETRERMYPPTVWVYQAPAEQTMSLELVEKPLLPGLDPGLSSFPSTSLTRFDDQGLGSQGSKDRESLEGVRKTLEQLAEGQARSREKEKALRERLRRPSGVVFVGKGSAREGVIDGEVVEGSHAVVVADDQGGKENRGVLIRLVRDAALGDDPGVEVVVRAANLVKDPSGTGSP